MHQVSILARPEGRALPADEYAALRAKAEVSILARPEGRALPRHPVINDWVVTSFNPRPPRRAGATCPFGQKTVPRSGFQSSPAPKGGRYARWSVTDRTTNVFQSSPAPKGGRYEQNGRYHVLENGVSILARPEGRALRSRKCIHSADWVFQSSPAPKGGRYAAAFAMASMIEVVSILARPEGRALRRMVLHQSSYVFVSILARPEGRALHNY